MYLYCLKSFISAVLTIIGLFDTIPSMSNNSEHLFGFQPDTSPEKGRPSHKDALTRYLATQARSMGRIIETAKATVKMNAELLTLPNPDGSKPSVLQMLIEMPLMGTQYARPGEDYDLRDERDDKYGQ